MGKGLNRVYILCIVTFDNSPDSFLLFSGGGHDMQDDPGSLLAADAPIREKIGRAHAFHRAWKDALLEDARIRGLVHDLILSVEASREIMLVCGVVEACRWCEEEAGGSCCGAGIENRYTSHLLLINLLMDVALPETRRWVESCYFLGESGCSLKARHVLCVNYLCERLQRGLSSGHLGELQRASGTELETGFALHEAVKKITGP